MSGVLDLPTAATWVLVGVIGLCLGSLGTLLAHRLPRGMAVGRARSACPACGQRLGVADLVPLVSWFIHRGRCRRCGAGVSARYPLTEAGTALLVLAALAAHGDGWAMLCVAGLAVALVVAILVDVEWLLIPDSMILAAAAFGVAWRGATDGAWIEAAAGLAVLGGLALALRAIFTTLRGVEALGLGDVKLMAVAGLWLPLAAIPAFLVFAGAAGVLTGIVWRSTVGTAHFPFGPGLAAGLYVTVLGLGLRPAAILV